MQVGWGGGKKSRLKREMVTKEFGEKIKINQGKYFLKDVPNRKTKKVGTAPRMLLMYQGMCGSNHSYKGIIEISK